MFGCWIRVVCLLEVGFIWRILDCYCIFEELFVEFFFGNVGVMIRVFHSFLIAQ